MMKTKTFDSEEFNTRIIHCTSCPRLIEWQRTIAIQKIRRYRDQEYWGKPVPSFGSAEAKLVIVGLAPAAHGANRTGRMFTGDRSGEWLYRCLFELGFCSNPQSRHSADGLTLIDTRITAVAHCAPPQNKLLKEEIIACRRFLVEEICSLRSKKVIVTLGRVAYEQINQILKSDVSAQIPRFEHNVSYQMNAGLLVIGSFHPSQQNTFTGKLTWEMFQNIFRAARGEIDRIS